MLFEVVHKRHTIEQPPKSIGLSYMKMPANMTLPETLPPEYSPW